MAFDAAQDKEATAVSLLAQQYLHAYRGCKLKQDIREEAVQADGCQFGRWKKRKELYSWD